MCSYENRGVWKKNYIEKKTIGDARILFKSCFGLQAFAGNYSHDRRFSKTDWLCRCQSAVEDEGHIVSGQRQVHGDLRTQFGDLGVGPKPGVLLHSSVR